MDEMLKDARFAHVARDPKFRRIPKAERKVKIDHRFKSMFKDEKFTVKYTIDKRGRPVNRTTTEDLRKYYDLPSSEDEDVSVPSTSKQDSEKKVKDTKKKEKKKNKKPAEEIESKIDSVRESSDKKNEDEKNKDDSLSNREELSGTITEEYSEDESSGESSDSEDKSIQKEFSQADLDKQLHERREDESGEFTKEIKEKLKDLTVDYARGEGVLLTDSSSEEELSEESGKIYYLLYLIYILNIFKCLRYVKNILILFRC